MCFFLFSPLKAWRSYNDGSRETLNGDASSSSLAAKGFRSVRPNLQEKKSPTQVKLHTLFHPLVLYISKLKDVQYADVVPYGALARSFPVIKYCLSVQQL